MESGNKNNPLLVLLHGFPDCWISWQHQISDLSEHFHVIALDLKGFGDSDKPQSRRCYRTEVILEELNSFISALGQKSCILIGHDLGALIGWYFVHLYPDVVNKFVAVSCPHPNLYLENLPNQSVFNTFWLNFVQLPSLPELEIMRDDLKIINDCYKHMQGTKDANSIIEAYKYSFSQPEDWTGPINYYRNLPFTRIETNNNQIIVPTLLITGNEDPFVRLEGIVKSTDFCQKFVMKIVEGAGHFPHQENPDLFNTLILNYLLTRSSVPKSPEKTLTKGLMDRMFGAVSSTVKYGNSVLDVVQKRTTSYVSLPNRMVQVQE